MMITRVNNPPPMYMILLPLEIAQGSSLVVTALLLDKTQKKPTCRNTYRHSNTSAYSSTNPPARPGCCLSSHPTNPNPPLGGATVRFTTAPPDDNYRKLNGEGNKISLTDNLLAESCDSHFPAVGDQAAQNERANKGGGKTPQHRKNGRNLTSCSPPPPRIKAGQPRGSVSRMSHLVT